MSKVELVREMTSLVESNFDADSIRMCSELNKVGQLSRDLSKHKEYSLYQRLAEHDLNINARLQNSIQIKDAYHTQLIVNLKLQLCVKIKK